MLRLRAFRPSNDKIVKIQLHPTHPWLVTADASDHVSVWNWEHRQVGIFFFELVSFSLWCKSLIWLIICGFLFVGDLWAESWWRRWEAFGWGKAGEARRGRIGWILWIFWSGSFGFRGIVMWFLQDSQNAQFSPFSALILLRPKQKKSPFYAFFFGCQKKPVNVEIS